MDFYRNHRSGTSAQSRLIGLLSRPGGDSIAGNSGVGVELHEDELFWSGSDSPEPIISQKPSSAATLATENPNRRSSPFRRIPEKSSGILAALVEDDKKGADVAAAQLLQRKPSTAASSASTSPSSARMIPAIPKPKTDYGGGKPFHQSAPVNIPIPPRFARHRYEASGGAGEVDEADGDDDEMLPPHEIIARRSGLGTPMTSFSVLEGVGRTLKGRDLRQVRNAVFRKTGAHHFIFGDFWLR
ncbi:uncharacterized protein LOC120252979 [Dioscorea cayenensis subsp. rotundata]|uniref:Uncharacterized protein LOC120252979 n=1 Tax=Dioscorea cayennensis subsp. rotundata TaxID=55577 RepID=A0AB40AQQ6_DIOCR|nr:uncharacterized protein LOC120252979 [Dioscorea cayenensis subsp. rotundata]